MSWAVEPPVARASVRRRARSSRWAAGEVEENHEAAARRGDDERPGVTLVPADTEVAQPGLREDALGARAVGAPEPESPAAPRWALAERGANREAEA